MQNILNLAFANDDSVATKLEVTAVISDQDMVLIDLLVHALKGKGCRYLVNGKKLTSAVYSRKEEDPTRKSIDLSH